MEDFQTARKYAAAITLSKKLTRRNFQPVICATLAEAKEHALQAIDPTKTVGFGGSLTVTASGLIPALYERGQKIIDRERTTTPEARHQVMRQALTADYFLTSINGIAETGELVNVDNIGNRIAALTFGPEKVLAFVSMNKVYGNLETTLERVRNQTAPLNSWRLNLKDTPCIKTGNCGNCLKPECICNTIAITRRSPVPERIVIYLILEDAGI